VCSGKSVATVRFGVLSFKAFRASPSRVIHAGVPKLDLSKTHAKGPERPSAIRLRGFQCTSSNSNTSPTDKVNGIDPPKTPNSAKLKHGVTWKLENNKTNGIHSQSHDPKDHPISPKSPGRQISANSCMFMHVHKRAPIRVNRVFLCMYKEWNVLTYWHGKFCVGCFYQYLTRKWPIVSITLSVTC